MHRIHAPYKILRNGNTAPDEQGHQFQGLSSSRLDTLSNQDIPLSMVIITLSLPVTRTKDFASRVPVVS